MNTKYPKALQTFFDDDIAFFPGAFDEIEDDEDVLKEGQIFEILAKNEYAESYLTICVHTFN